MQSMVNINTLYNLMYIQKVLIEESGSLYLGVLCFRKTGLLYCTWESSTSIRLDSCTVPGCPLLS